MEECFFNKIDGTDAKRRLKDGFTCGAHLWDARDCCRQAVAERIDPNAGLTTAATRVQQLRTSYQPYRLYFFGQQRKAGIEDAFK